MANDGTTPDDTRGLITLCVTAIVAGAATGFVGGAFRWCLRIADRWRLDLLDWVHRAPGPAWLVPLAVTALGAGAAAAIVRIVPLSSGSGIQHVEAVSRGEAEPPPPSVVPARFAGGLLAIGSGLILGREGPTVHMGAALGAEAGRRARMTTEDIRLSQSALAGAGLAVAFNAPIGGTLFVFEEITGRFRVRTAIPTLLAVAVAVGCSRIVLGNQPDFAVPPVATQAVALLPLFVVFGLLTGVLGIAYNRLLTGLLTITDPLRRRAPILLAAAIGAIVGALLLVDPADGGGGDTLSQRIVGGGTVLVPAALAFLLIRFVAGPLSYAAGTPGGLFAPMLAVGALWGLLFAHLSATVLPVDAHQLTVPLAIVGMSAFFGATVRAPVTGIALVMEMTATATITVPMAAAGAAAVLVAHLAGAPPIYDSLRERMLRT